MVRVTEEQPLTSSPALLVLASAEDQPVAAARQAAQRSHGVAER
ncbi:hypothetical protein [Streptomyces sp. NPDC060322]